MRPVTDRRVSPVKAAYASFPLPWPPYRIIHLPYDEAPRHTLAAIRPDGRHVLRGPAAQAFLAMQAAARREGVLVEPVSAFRSLSNQVETFYGVARERRQSLAQRAQVAAPPGFSEHHTGYVLDVMDGWVPETADLELAFERTPAFRWLCQHAHRFGFELSFPRGNGLGVCYEPWHWRYVGTPHSRATFQRARQVGCVLR